MPPYDNSKSKGASAELEVACWLKRNGYSVSFPFGENAPNDLIVESQAGKLYRVQVRCASWKKDTLTLSLRIVSKNYSRTIDRERVDTFVIWSDEGEAFVIPSYMTLENGAEFRIRRSAPRNGQKKGVRLAETFREALGLMP